MADLVIITGASKGLGLAIAEQTPFSARIIDISRSGPPEGTAIEHIEADLSNARDWIGILVMIRQIVDQGRPTRSVFVHAAATLNPIGFAGEVEDGPYVDNVLLNSAVGQVLGHGYLSAIGSRPGVHDLVMISSGAASSSYPGWSSYGAGKAALNQWVRYVGAEQEIRGGARVSAVAPGVIDTEMQSQIRQMSESDFPQVQRFRDLHERGELVAPADAARRIWEAIESGLEPGSVIDLRDL